MATYTRVLSENELSYFLPSRQDGINDMSVHVAFRAPAPIVSPLRVAIVWALLRLRHPLLASQVRMDPGAYSDTRFAYTPPSSPSSAILEARATLEVLSNTTVEDVIDGFLNGPRVLSSQHMSYLYVVERPGQTTPTRSYDMMLCLTHFLGDGGAGHQLGHLFFALLGGPASPGGPVRSDLQLGKLLETEWKNRWAAPSVQGDIIPTPAEERLPCPLTKFQKAVADVDFKATQTRVIGGHVFPRVPTRTRKIATSKIIFDRTKTQAILAKCKSEWVTVSSALFVICNFAWIRTRQAAPPLLSPAEQQQAPEALPMMIYTAASLRPYLAPGAPAPPHAPASFLFLALTYFNIVLPAFVPAAAPPAAIFWHRARQVHAQSRKYLASPLFAARTRCMGTARARRAISFAAEDDAAPAPRRAPAPPPARPAGAPRAPSVALLGLSQLGSLDGVYLGAAYPAVTLTRAFSRTRRSKGGLLVFSHTFRGELYLAVEWDAAGVRGGVVERFWAEVGACVEEFLVGERVAGARL